MSPDVNKGRLKTCIREIRKGTADLLERQPAACIQSRDLEQPSTFLETKFRQTTCGNRARHRIQEAGRVGHHGLGEQLRSAFIRL